MKTKIVTVWNLKGGVGKTTCTFNLAAELLRRGNRVLCVDLDFQGNLSSFWDREIINAPEKQDILSLLDEADASKCVYTSRTTGLDLIRLHRVSKIPEDMPATAIQTALEKMEGYDYIFIDMHPYAGALERSALSAADCVLIPICLDKFSRDNLNLAIDTLSEIGAKKVGVVANRLRNQCVQRLVLDDLVKRHDYPILENGISDRTAIPSASALGKPVFAHRSKSPAATDFADLADEMISLLQEG